MCVGRADLHDCSTRMRTTPARQDVPGQSVAGRAEEPLARPAWDDGVPASGPLSLRAGPPARLGTQEPPAGSVPCLVQAWSLVPTAGAEHNPAPISRKIPRPQPEDREYHRPATRGSWQIEAIQGTAQWSGGALREVREAGPQDRQQGELTRPASGGSVLTARSTEAAKRIGWNCPSAFPIRPAISLDMVLRQVATARRKCHKAEGGQSSLISSVHHALNETSKVGAGCWQSGAGVSSKIGYSASHESPQGGGTRRLEQGVFVSFRPVQEVAERRLGNRAWGRPLLARIEQRPPGATVFP